MNTSKMLDDYATWLRNQYKIKTIDESDEITTPFENMIGDNMRIYVTPLSSDRIRISDDGTIFEDLFLYGIDVTSYARKRIIDKIKKRYGIDQIDDTLSVSGKISNFPAMKQNLITAMIQINDLSNTKKSNVESLFYEEIYSYFQENDFGGLSGWPAEGKSGVSYAIDYTIPEKKNRPQRMIDFQQKISMNEVLSNAYKFTDILGSSTSMLKSIPTYSIIFNSDDGNVSEKAQKIADEARIGLIPWNNKKLLLELR
ncbi:DUF1828 domain-containing protein [Levilactobacillus brevis]|uniref:DUF1828 domain-containing protein n=2 Tax=Levilactobacillus brevis TaxID=1580 RepID=UPI0005AB1072|nr:DUF1828 domain-containing protein [Levilactobacillus brevis]KLE28949.1 hypothetical protein AAX72_10955 [Levilactobacillus brevis]KWT52219.1 hypothetical protein ABB39_00010 [Levilactobacillus brevis]KWU40398.1 hypothetical protein AV935_07425 [Levilactobacillus brevis]MCB4357919.1 DUF1828 domain-containing protein [Levilactobacillus brevis]MCB4357997.1 DUF1828 domain-containing protein [Levilactobacillus brevis]